MRISPTHSAFAAIATEALHDLRHGLHALGKTPGFTVAAVVTLALGIGANTAVFSLVDCVVLRSLPYPDAARIMTLWEQTPARGRNQERVTPPDFADWQAQQHSFERMGWWNGNTELNVLLADGIDKVRCTYAHSGLFAVLGVTSILGRGLSPEDDRNQGPLTAVISHDFWQRRHGGRADVVGGRLTIDSYNRREYTIVGVMPPGFRFPDQCDVWLAAGWNPGGPTRREGHWYAVLGRLGAGVTREQAATELSAIQGRIAQQYTGVGTHVSVVPLLEQTLGPNLQRALFALWGIVACVLLIACANVANLMLARAAARHREVAIRLALGATRWRIARQLLWESLLLAVAGGVVGITLAYAGLKVLVVVAGARIPRLDEVGIDATSILFTLVAALTTAVFFGIAPAWQGARTDLNEALKEGTRSGSAGRGRSRFRRGLVVGEVAVALMLLIATGLMTRSFVRLTQIDRGFEPDQLLTAALDFSVTGYTTWIQATATRPQVTLQQLMERLAVQPGVRSVAATYRLPRGSDTTRLQTLSIEHRPEAAGETLSGEFCGITPGYFRTMSVAMRQGRDFTERDLLDAPKVAIVNETFARRYFPSENPVGKRLMFGRMAERRPDPTGASPWIEIVGVTADIRKLELGAASLPDVFVPYWQWPMQSPVLLVRTTGKSSGVPLAIRTELKAINPNVPVPVIRPMNEILSDTVAEPRFQAMLAGLFGVIALGLALVGIYGVMAYGVTQRVHEIGIRMALGAQRRDVLGLIIGHGMTLVIMGLALGGTGAWGATRFLASMLYGVSPTDPLTYAAMSVLLASVAWLACYLPARRASKVDPLVALRCE